MSADRPVISDRAIQIVAENKILAAIEAGEFDYLPGLGRPSALIDEPYDPFWWMRRKLQRENLQKVDLAVAACRDVYSSTAPQCGQFVTSSLIFI